MTFAWDKIKVSVPFSTETLEAVKAGIDAAVAKGENLSGVYAKAADYFIDEEDTETAKVYLDKSIGQARGNFSACSLKQVPYKSTVVIIYFTWILI